jgi:preprotein translocase subunit SecF
MYNIISKNKIWISISAGLIAISITALLLWGLKFGIDFTGGSLLEVSFTENRPSVTEVEDSLKSIDLQSLTVQPVAENEMILRFQNTDEEIHQAVLTTLQTMASGNNEAEKTANFEELRFEAVGSSIGQELKNKSVYAIILVLLAISLYIAWAFRRVSRPVTSWKYGMATIISLFHDTLIVLGFFAYLGEFHGVEINVSFVAAILTVLGFSVHDTIVVFDRLRENLPRSNDDFSGTVNTSVNQTITRSINTSFTVLLVLLAITLMGGSSIHYFALALLIGVFFGTYSSIFLASPLLVFWHEMKQRRG